MTTPSGQKHPGGPDDGELLARVQQGDREAFDALFHRYYRGVYAFVHRRLGDAPLAEETVMDTFFEVWRSAGSFRAESRPSSWIFGIAHFKAIAANRHRRQLKRSSVVAVASEDLERAPERQSLEETLEARDEVNRLRVVVQSLGEMQRRTAELVWLRGMSHEEAAEELGVSPDSVKTRLWRARQRMRRELRPPHTGEPT